MILIFSFRINCTYACISDVLYFESYIVHSTIKARAHIELSFAICNSSSTQLYSNLTLHRCVIAVLFKLIHIFLTHTPLFTTLIFSPVEAGKYWCRGECYLLGTLHSTNSVFIVCWRKIRAKLGPLFHRPLEGKKTTLTHYALTINFCLKDIDNSDLLKSW